MKYYCRTIKIILTIILNVTAFVTFVVGILTSRFVLEANLRGIMRCTFEESRMNYHILLAAFYELDPIATRQTLEIKRGERPIFLDKRLDENYRPFPRKSTVQLCFVLTRFVFFIFRKRN